MLGQEQEADRNMSVHSNAWLQSTVWKYFKIADKN